VFEAGCCESGHAFPGCREESIDVEFGDVLEIGQSTDAEMLPCRCEGATGVPRRKALASVCQLNHASSDQNLHGAE